MVIGWDSLRYSGCVGFSSKRKMAACVGVFREDSEAVLWISTPTFLLASFPLISGANDLQQLQGPSCGSLVISARCQCQR